MQTIKRKIYITEAENNDPDFEPPLCKCNGNGCSWCGGTGLEPVEYVLIEEDKEAA